MEQADGFVLASASPRRRDILTQLGLDFRVVPGTVEERHHRDELPRAFASRMAAAKADDVARTLAVESRDAFILGADTIVVIDDEILGKPRDDGDAYKMLQRLSGRWHEVMTAIALRRIRSAFQADQVVSTRVLFRELDEGMVTRYIASGEGRDKAGSYAIQGLGIGLVCEIEGCYTNVVGLPATQTLALLMREGVVRKWP